MNLCWWPSLFLREESVSKRRELKSVPFKISQNRMKLLKEKELISAAIQNGNVNQGL